MPEQEFKLSPSTQYIFLMFIVILSSLLIFVCLPCSLLIKCIGCLFLLAYGYFLIWHHGLLKSRYSITALKYAGDGRWHVFRNNQLIAANLLGDSTATGRVSILRFRLPNRIRPLSCVVFSDALKPDQYRQLLVALKMG